jgi:hypothetical protein
MRSIRDPNDYDSLTLSPPGVLILFRFATLALLASLSGLIVGVSLDIRFLGPDRLTTGWETPHLWIYRHYWDVILVSVDWVYFAIASIGVPLNFSIQIADELPAFLFWAPFVAFFSFFLFIFFLFSAQSNQGEGRSTLSQAFSTEQKGSQLRQLFPPLRATKRPPPVLPSDTEDPAPLLAPPLDEFPSVSSAQVVHRPAAERATCVPRDFDHFERVLLKSEASLETLRLGLEAARRAGVNLVIDPSIAQAYSDLQELRSSLDEIDLAIEELRGHQHLLMATLASKGDAKRVV